VLLNTIREEGFIVIKSIITFKNGDRYFQSTGNCNSQGYSEFVDEESSAILYLPDSVIATYELI